MHPPFRLPRTPEERYLFGQLQELDAAVLDMLESGLISLNQRNTISNRLIHARLLAENERTEEARQSIKRIAGIVAGWRETGDTHE
jgi:hypothetical protein